MKTPVLSIQQLAALVHAANKAICEAAGDNSQKPWAETSDSIKASAIAGVHYRLANPNATAEDQHNEWCDFKRAEGWVYGPVKDTEKKIHPCLVPYAELPFEQRVKDHVFAAIVNELSY